jgi:hypothetical protein
MLPSRGGARSAPRQARHPDRVQGCDRHRGQGCPAASRGPVFLAHRRLAPGSRHRRLGRAPAQAQAQARARPSRPRSSGCAGVPNAPRASSPSTRWPWSSRESIGALGTAAGRERRGDQVAAVIDALFSKLEPLLGAKTACRAVGRPRASHYRRRRPRAAPAAPTDAAERLVGDGAGRGARHPALGALGRRLASPGGPRPAR